MVAGAAVVHEVALHLPRDVSQQQPAALRLSQIGVQRGLEEGVEIGHGVLLPGSLPASIAPLWGERYRRREWRWPVDHRQRARDAAVVGRHDR